MRKFRFRHPRFLVDVPVKFIASNSAQAVRCTEISEEGMRLELLQPLQSNACGKVSLCHRDRTFEFNVRVASVGATHAGLEFICASSAERSQVAQLVASLTTLQGPPALVLVRGRR